MPDTQQTPVPLFPEDVLNDEPDGAGYLAFDGGISALTYSKRFFLLSSVPGSIRFRVRRVFLSAPMMGFILFGVIACSWNSALVADDIEEAWLRNFIEKTIADPPTDGIYRTSSKLNLQEVGLSAAEAAEVFRKYAFKQSEDKTNWSFRYSTGKSLTDVFCGITPFEPPLSPQITCGAFLVPHVL